MSRVNEGAARDLTPSTPLSAWDSSVTDSAVRGEGEGIRVDPYPGWKMSRRATSSTPGYSSYAPGRGSLRNAGFLPAVVGLGGRYQVRRWFARIIHALAKEIERRGASTREELHSYQRGGWVEG